MVLERTVFLYSAIDRRGVSRVSSLTQTASPVVANHLTHWLCFWSAAAS